MTGICIHTAQRGTHTAASAGTCELADTRAFLGMPQANGFVSGGTGQHSGVSDEAQRIYTASMSCMTEAHHGIPRYYSASE